MAENYRFGPGLEFLLVIAVVIIMAITYCSYAISGQVLVQLR